MFICVAFLSVNAEETLGLGEDRDLTRWEGLGGPGLCM